MTLGRNDAGPERRGDTKGQAVEADFEDVVAVELPKLLRYATTLAGDPDQGEDMVQEVLARAYRRWATVGRADNPGAYLMRMVTNEFLSWRRRWSTRSITAVEATVLERVSAAGDDPQTEVVERLELERRLAALPRRQQAALVLRYLEGLDYAECAAVLGCAEGTVRSSCSRGLAALRIDGSAPRPATPTARTESA